ncbi:hypothetical protein [Amycolatopsis minnesotensis]|uniref:Uncharacterized protein n=1 Tax=Amycolatopsis minnesotensis TaxID=337894 RepID=A0ABN2SDW2_9PSEU
MDNLPPSRNPCHYAMMHLPPDHTIDGVSCIVQDDKIYLYISHID